MNGLDLFLIALTILVAWTGYRRGALRQLLSWGGLAAGLLAGALIAPLMAQISDNPVNQVGLALASIVIGGVIGNLAGRLLGSMAGSAAKNARLGPVDSTAGVAIAVVALAFITWFIAFNLVNGPFPGVAREIRESVVVKGLDSTLPEPPAIFAEVRDFFNRFGFPQVFSGLPPAPAGAVDEPSQADASAAFDKAADSTMRVVGRGCDQIQEGSGFVFAPNYVLTNAHVVAGVDSPQVQQQDGGTQTATPVIFDPLLDVAVLRVAETPGPVLPLVGENVDRGTGGAVVGFPGGGNLTGVKAAVRQVIEAEGRDIYGRKRVSREVYELQTEVMPGNSGGPFVLPDGTVAGLVFAASSTDDNVGYAITSTQLEEDIGLAVTRVSPADTGRCVP